MNGSRYASRMLDISGGQQSGVSEYGLKSKHLVRSENVEFRPYRTCRVRKGSQRLNTELFDGPTNTLMEWVAPGGTSYKYAVVDAGAAGAIRRMVPGGGFVAQTTPAAISDTNLMVWDQLNGAIFATENTGTGHPILYRASNPADTWYDGVYPTPGATLTLTPGNTATGAMTPALYYAYRLRWTYTDGSSPASSPQTVLMGGADDTVAVTTIPLGTARTDCTGWILERTGPGSATAAAALLLPFYYVASGTGATFNAPGDVNAEADLGYRSNDNWYRGVPSGHFDGVIALPDRLAGWVGSTLYVSQPLGDDSSAGILNFDGRNAYDFGAGDGDSITAVVKQNDRLIVFKQNSVWAFEGNDPSNFSVVPLWQGVGASGCRAAAGMGATIWFYGAAGLHRIVGNEVAPFGYVEVGDVVESFSPARIADVVVRNHLGQRVLISFSQRGSFNDSFLVHDLRYRTWSEWRGWYANDILVPKVPDFGDRESFLIADHKSRPNGGGVEYPLWIAFFGTKDEKAYDGTGGTDLRVALKTPWIDDGQPDAEKVFEWLQVYAFGANVTLTAQVETDPPTQVATLSLPLPGRGELWAAFTWGDGTIWGSTPNEASAERGIPLGCRGRRYRITYTANVPDTFGFRGHVVSVIPQPRKEYSK